MELDKESGILVMRPEMTEYFKEGNRLDTVRTGIVVISLLFFCFFLPLQCFVIGDYWGAGIQGAVYRYQITGMGSSLIPITYELGYVSSGIYQGAAAAAAILWAVGTLVLAGITILALISAGNFTGRDLRIVKLGCAGSCTLYFASCITRYGVFFSGPVGISLPLGILIMAVFVVLLHKYPELFLISPDTPDGE